MKYSVHVWDEATYEIDANNPDEAEEIANELFDQRIHATDVSDFKEPEK